MLSWLNFEYHGDTDEFFKLFEQHLNHWHYDLRRKRVFTAYLNGDKFTASEGYLRSTINFSQHLIIPNAYSPTYSTAKSQLAQCSAILGINLLDAELIGYGFETSVPTSCSAETLFRFMGHIPRWTRNKIDSPTGSSLLYAVGSERFEMVPASDLVRKNSRCRNTEKEPHHRLVIKYGLQNGATSKLESSAGRRIVRRRMRFSVDQFMTPKKLEQVILRWKSLYHSIEKLNEPRFDLTRIPRNVDELKRCLLAGCSVIISPMEFDERLNRAYKDGLLTKNEHKTLKRFLSNLRTESEYFIRQENVDLLSAAVDSEASRLLDSLYEDPAPSEAEPPEHRKRKEPKRRALITTQFPEF